MRCLVCSLCVLFLSSLWQPRAWAETLLFHGDTNLICATLAVVTCNEARECQEGDAQAFELPTFIYFDLKNQQVRATDEMARVEVSNINLFEKTEKQLILQGIDGHRGWTVAISRENGQMMIAVTGDGISFMVLGTCTREPIKS